MRALEIVKLCEGDNIRFLLACSHFPITPSDSIKHMSHYVMSVSLFSSTSQLRPAPPHASRLYLRLHAPLWSTFDGVRVFFLLASLLFDVSFLVTVFVFLWRVLCCFFVFNVF